MSLKVLSKFSSNKNKSKRSNRGRITYNSKDILLVLNNNSSSSHNSSSKFLSQRVYWRIILIRSRSSRRVQWSQRTSIRTCTRKTRTMLMIMMNREFSKKRNRSSKFSNNKLFNRNNNHSRFRRNSSNSHSLNSSRNKCLRTSNSTRRKTMSQKFKMRRKKKMTSKWKCFLSIITRASQTLRLVS